MLIECPENVGCKMKLNEKIELVSILKELVRTGELDVYNPQVDESLRGENIRTIYMRGDVITICLSESYLSKNVK